VLGSLAARKRGPGLTLIAVLVAGALVTACGGSSPTTPAATPNETATSNANTTSGSSVTGGSTTATTGTTTTATTSSTSRRTTATGSRTSADTGGASASGGASTSTTNSATTAPQPAVPTESLAAAVAVCIQEVHTAAVLTTAEKSQLANLCSVAGSGDRARVRAVEKRVCLTVIQDSAPGLGGAAIEAAKQSCNRF
jgi:hypothetical protein